MEGVDGARSSRTAHRKRSRIVRASSDLENEAGPSRSRPSRAKSSGALIARSSQTNGEDGYNRQTGGEDGHHRQTAYGAEDREMEGDSQAQADRQQLLKKRKSKNGSRKSHVLGRPSLVAAKERVVRGKPRQRGAGIIEGNVETAEATVEAAETPETPEPKRPRMSLSRSLNRENEGAVDLVDSDLLLREAAEKDKRNTALVETLQEELKRLQKEIAFKDGVIDAQKDTIGHIHTQFTCAVCMDLVWRPHVLTPCGHVFCARCLLAYFQRPLPDEASFGDSNLTPEQLRKATLRRKKVCPHCREQVKVAPAEVWLIKGLLDRVDDSMNRGEGHEDVITSPHEATRSIQERKGMDLPIGVDLWKDVFSKKPAELEPFFDEQDGVYRCPHCANEVVDGRCTFPSCDFGTSEYYDDIIDDEEGEGEDHDDEEDDDYDDLHNSIGSHGWPYPGRAYDLVGPGYELDEYDSEYDSDYAGEDDEDDEMNSFIDNGEPIVVDDTMTDEGDDDDDSEEIQEVDQQGRPIDRFRRHQSRLRRPIPVEDVGDEDISATDENLSIHAEEVDHDDEETQSFEDAPQEYRSDEDAEAFEGDNYANSDDSYGGAY